MSDYEIYFTPKYYKFNYLTLKKTLEDDVASLKVDSSVVPSVEMSSLRVGARVGDVV